MFIGLLMVCHEDDILPETLQRHTEFVDAFYVLDGTVPNRRSKKLCESFSECARYTRDRELTGPVRDGSRGLLYQQAVSDFGHDNWFCLLHADEVWTFYPWHLTREYPAADGFIFNLPCYFPREGEPYDTARPALEQLLWHLEPGWPEFRMFKGAPNVRYDPGQHFDVMPKGLTNVIRTDWAIRHYPYRSPESQMKRAVNGFDPDNYKHVVEGNVYWSDEMIASWQTRTQFRRLVKDPS